MSFDSERYVTEVLEPARLAGNRVPADLWVRYALTEQILEGNLKEHLLAVYKLWQRQIKPHKYRELANALIAEHVALSPTLTASDLRARREEWQKRASARLTKRVEVLAATASMVTPADLDDLVAQVEGKTRDEVRNALAGVGVAVVEPPELPASPPTAKFTSLVRSLNAAGVRHSFDLLYGKGTFSVLNGFRTSASSDGVADLVARLRKEQELLGTQGSTPKRDSLRILEEVAAAGKYADCLLCEVVGRLRRTGSGARFHGILTNEAIDLGLEPADAALVALALISGSAESIDPVFAVIEEIEMLLSSGSLREAEQRTLGIDRASDPRLAEIGDRVDASVREVRHLVDQADAELQRGRGEAAAEFLAAAVRSAADDQELGRRLARLAPPAPTGLRAVVADSGVRLSWVASASRVGDVVYRVVRDSVSPTSPLAGTVVSSGPGLEAVDSGAPAAEDLHYAVFASRAEGVWSGPAVIDPVVVTPELTDVVLEATARWVTGSWGVHAAAVEVVVVRRKDRVPAHSSDGQVIRGSRLQGFTDDNVTTGQTYYYRAAAVYTTSSGERRTTPGVVATARPERPAEVVSDLDVAIQLDTTEPRLELTWTAPSGGTVTIRQADAAPQWSTGVRISLAELARQGRPHALPDDRRTDGRNRLQLPPTFGRTFFTVYSVSGPVVLVGNTVSITLVEPVRRLLVERLGGTMRLSWEWPDRSTSAKVRWWAVGAAPSTASEVLCRRRVYEDDGGFSLDIGPGAAMVTVEASLEDPDGPVTVAPATVHVSPLPTEIPYVVVRQRSLRSERARLRFTAIEACELPPIDVVYATGRVMPLDASGGTVLTTLPPTLLEPGVPYEKEVEVPWDRGPSWLVCFVNPVAASGSSVTLVPPPVRELMAG